MRNTHMALDGYVGDGAIELLIKIAAVTIGLHVLVALASNVLQVSWYQTLTTTETAVAQGFVTWFFNTLGDAWHRFVGIFFGG